MSSSYAFEFEAIREAKLEEMLNTINTIWNDEVHSADLIDARGMGMIEGLQKTHFVVLNCFFGVNDAEKIKISTLIKLISQNAVDGQVYYHRCTTGDYSFYNINKTPISIEEIFTKYTPSLDASNDPKYHIKL